MSTGLFPLFRLETIEGYFFFQLVNVLSVTPIFFSAISFSVNPSLAHDSIRFNPSSVIHSPYFPICPTRFFFLFLFPFFLSVITSPPLFIPFIHYFRNGIIPTH